MGPFDLGNNIGYPIIDGTMHDELKEAIAKIQRAAKENKKSSGIYSVSGDQARHFADQGFNMVRYGSIRMAGQAWLMSEGLCHHRYGRAAYSHDIGFGIGKRLLCAFGTECW